MQITKIESLHADAGWRVWSFLKIETDRGITGWAEYNESYGSPGLSTVIQRLGEQLVGRDPRPVEAITAELYARTRQAPGGVIAQAVAAIENALVDIKARDLNVPVYALLGGPVRNRLRLYWSHCGSYRLAYADQIGCKPLQSLEDLQALGAEVAARGFTALKMNIAVFGEQPFMFQPGFALNPGWPEVNVDRALLTRIDEQLTAMRAGAGPDTDILLDMNFNAKTEGYRRVAHLADQHDLMWLEIDLFDPDGLALIRRDAKTAIASCESLFGRRQFLPYFQARAMDVAIVDVPWNGILEAVKIAAMADAFEINCAPHNFYGNLSTAMSAHFCAAIPNFRIMEIDIDDVPWKDALVTAPAIKDGYLVLTEQPGWGVTVDEDTIRAHPAKK